MTWLKEKVLWIAGAVVALVSIYILGRRDGKNAVKNDTNEKLLDQAKAVRDTNNLSFDELVDRMRKYSDK